MKYTRILFCALFILSFSFLHGQKEKPLVVASASIFKDMTEVIADNLVDVDLIVPVGADPHVHEPTPRDAKLVTKADLILVNGLTFEGWIDELIENSGTKAKVVVITKGVPAIRSEEYVNSADPHAWMNPLNGIIYVNNIAKALIELDPKNEAAYAVKRDEYISELTKLDQYIRTEIKKIPAEKRVLITSHDAFAYYARAFNLEVQPLVGLSTEADVQTSDIQRVSKTIKERDIPAIFTESTINPKLLKQIASDRDIFIGGDLFADSLDEEGKPGGTYIGMLKHNTDVIVAALTATSDESIEASDEATGGYLSYILLGGLMLIGLLFLVFKMR